MDWQTLCALAIVAGVAVLLARWKVRSLHRDITTPCGGSCACGASPRQGGQDGSLEKTIAEPYHKITDNQEGYRERSENRRHH